MNLKELANQLRSAAALIEDIKEVREEKLPESWDESKAEHGSFCGCSLNVKKSLYALSQLYDLRQEYWRIANWEPDWNRYEQIKFVIELFVGDYIITQKRQTRFFLVFPTKDQAKHFLEHHEGLIGEAQEFL